MKRRIVALEGSLGGKWPPDVRKHWRTSATSFSFQRKRDPGRFASSRSAIAVIMSQLDTSKPSLFAAWNWSRGLFRLWVVAAICWEAFWLGVLWIEGANGDPVIILFVFFGVPAGLLIFGALIRWAIRGFREMESPGRGSLLRDRFPAGIRPSGRGLTATSRGDLVEAVRAGGGRASAAAGSPWSRSAPSALRRAIA